MKILLLIMPLILASCAIDLTPQPEGGSKADAMVSYSAVYGKLYKPTIDWDYAKNDAVKKCKG